MQSINRSGDSFVISPDTIPNAASGSHCMFVSSVTLFPRPHLSKELYPNRGNQHTNMTFTKLHDVCEKKQTEDIIQIMESYPQMALSLDAHMQTPLHILCGFGSPDVEGVLAIVNSYPACIIAQDLNGDTPLHVLCRSPHVTKHMVHLLLKHGGGSKVACITNKEGLMPLHVACRHNAAQEDVMGLLLDVYPSAVHMQIKMGSLASPSRKRSSSLSNESERILHPILDHNQGMDHATFTDLQFAQAHAQIRDGAYPLHMALRNGASVGVVEMLIKASEGSDIGSNILLLENKWGETPLHVACAAAADEDVIRILVQMAPEAAHRQDHQGNLPVHDLVVQGESCTVHAAKDLLEVWPGMVFATNQAGKTALDMASCHGCSPEVLHLMDILQSG